MRNIDKYNDRTFALCHFTEELAVLGMLKIRKDMNGLSYGTFMAGDFNDNLPTVFITDDSPDLKYELLNVSVDSVPKDFFLIPWYSMANMICEVFEEKICVMQLWNMAFQLSRNSLLTVDDAMMITKPTKDKIHTAILVCQTSLKLMDNFKDIVKKSASLTTIQ